MVYASRNSFTFIISFMAMILGISLSTPTVHSADVILMWDRPDDARVSGYKIFYGPADTDFKAVPNETILSPAQTSCDIYNLKAGTTYGFAAKSTDKEGNESVFSETIFYDVPIEPPNDDPNGHDDDDDEDDGNGGNGDDGNNGDNGDGSDDDDNDGEGDKRGGGSGGCFIRVVSAP
ncbi:MAG: fibronectin type III domain-containing protein [Desulfobacteraceae bacterium]|jgi:hypothetical protein|nr:MAG: fibronectin type III domain-containing protein [Desulfobacteraceae bacterium]